MKEKQQQQHATFDRVTNAAERAELDIYGRKVPTSEECLNAADSVVRGEASRWWYVPRLRANALHREPVEPMPGSSLTSPFDICPPEICAPV